MTLDEAKAYIRRDLLEVLNLTAVMLKPDAPTDGISAMLAGRMAALAKKIRAADCEPIMVQAFDAIVLEAHQLRGGTVKTDPAARESAYQEAP